MSFVSVTVKHGNRTLIAQQVLEVDSTKNFKQLFNAAVAEAQQYCGSSREEFQLLSDERNLETHAQLSNSQQRNGGECPVPRVPPVHGTVWLLLDLWLLLKLWLLL